MFFACGTEISCHQYSFASAAARDEAHMLLFLSLHTQIFFNRRRRYFSPVAKVLSDRRWESVGVNDCRRARLHCVASALCPPRV
jgi:hypothetical protein